MLGYGLGGIQMIEWVARLDTMIRIYSERIVKTNLVEVRFRKWELINLAGGDSLIEHLSANSEVVNPFI
jgi:hypothetical protein